MQGYNTHQVLEVGYKIACVKLNKIVFSSIHTQSTGKACELSRNFQYFCQDSYIGNARIRNSHKKQFYVLSYVK